MCSGELEMSMYNIDEWGEKTLGVVSKTCTVFSIAQQRNDRVCYSRILKQHHNFNLLPNSTRNFWHSGTSSILKTWKFSIALHYYLTSLQPITCSSQPVLIKNRSVWSDLLSWIMTILEVRLADYIKIIGLSKGLLPDGSTCLPNNVKFSQGLDSKIKGTTLVTFSTPRGCFWDIFNSNFEGVAHGFWPW